MAGINNYSNIMYSTQQKPQQQQQIYVEDEAQMYADDPRTLYSTGANLSRTDMRSGAATSNLQRSQLHFTLDDERSMYVNSLASVGDNYLKYVSSGADLSLPLEKSKVADNLYEEDDYRSAVKLTRTLNDEESLNVTHDSDNNQVSMRKYLGMGVQWVSLLTENLLSHPFVVLRRQCQVYHASQRYHLQPFSLMPSIIHLHRRQGVTTLWKGLGSCLLVRGMSLAVDDVLSKLTLWPKEVDSRTTFKKFGQHLILKCASIAIVLPFYAASLVETVQSDIASEKPGILDVFREGSLRMLYWSSPQKGRMLPAWALVGPSVTLGITKYIFGLVIKGISARVIRRRIQQRQEQKGAKFKDDSLENQNVEIYSNLISMLTTEAIFYPFETIVHRIQLQGTRTIIDNLDNGYAVVPILTNYQGAFDCYRTTVASEGISGLYKGFGAIVLQFAAHIAVIKITKWVVNQITEVISNRPPSKVMQYYNIERGVNSASTTISRSLSSSSDFDASSVGQRSVDE